MLGVLIDDPEPLRLREVSAHPASYGFPAGHPVMNTFLGVPVMIGDCAWGNLYLAQKAGGEEFDQPRIHAGDDNDFLVGEAVGAEGFVFTLRDERAVAVEHFGDH